MSSSEPTHNEVATKTLWTNPEFAARYKSTEAFTGEHAYDLLKQMGLESYTSPVHFLDLACGTGIVSKRAIELLQSQANRSWSSDKFTCADISAEMLKVVRSRVEAEDWPVSVEAVEANMTDTKLPSDAYTHLCCNFGPALAPGPDRVLSESFRTLKTGGVAGWSSWQRTGWMPDMTAAMHDIRTDATQKCDEGTGTNEDQQLSKIPSMMKFEDMMGKLAGVDLVKLRAEGTPEKDLPRWDQGDYFQSRAEKAGFTNVKVAVVEKTMTLERQEASAMLKPMVNILKTFWTEQERKDVEGAELTDRIDKWFEQRFQRGDVKDGKVTWSDWRAILLTGTKPEQDD